MSPLRVAALSLLLLLALAAPAAARPSQEAMFQDDNLLVYGDGGVAGTLDELKALGIDRVRISVFWAVVAPADRPSGFDASDPSTYPSGSWDRYDTVVRLAQERGIGVNFDITTPAPDWATDEPERADLDDTNNPDATEYGKFVHAVGERYDGSHGPPRVDHWSFMNEPNQPGWLTPQWTQVDGRWVETAARIYRDLVDAGWQALADTGHGSDTILIGELAPKGLRTNRGETRAVDALRFIRRLYCLDDFLQTLKGSTAAALGCPTDGSFAERHPALFNASGWAQHPYELIFSPSTKPGWRDWATIANLGTLQTLLRKVRLRYKQSNRTTPIYLTEFGYQTRPPDRTGVTPAQQSAYLNEAEFIAYRRSDVIGLSQFLLLDDGDPVDRTFQTGLLFRDGTRKPAYAAYRMPLFLPKTKVKRGRSLRVWGGARFAGKGAALAVELRAKGSKRWARVRTLTTRNERGYVDARVRFRRSGRVRLRSGAETSRSVSIRVNG